MLIKYDAETAEFVALLAKHPELWEQLREILRGGGADE